MRLNHLTYPLNELHYHMTHMTKEEIQFQKEMFETQRQWLQREYKEAKAAKPKNDAKIFELENRIKSFEREVHTFQKRKKEQEGK